MEYCGILRNSVILLLLEFLVISGKFKALVRWKFGSMEGKHFSGIPYQRNFVDTLDHPVLLRT
jgi:hypothetical protein